MTILLIKTKNGIYRSKQSLHCLMLEEHKIKLDDVLNCGFLTKGREIWVNRKPH